jgi:hypothetical protein
MQGLGRPTVAAALRGLNVGPTFDGLEITEFRGRKIYAALLVDGQGLTPLRGGRRSERASLLREIASESDAKVAVVGLDANVVAQTLDREWIPENAPVVSDDGFTVFSDGVLFSGKVDDLQL